MSLAPLRSDAAIMARHSSTVLAMGFSHMTCRPGLERADGVLGMEPVGQHVVDDLHLRVLAQPVEGLVVVDPRLGHAVGLADAGGLVGVAADQRRQAAAPRAGDGRDDVVEREGAQAHHRPAEPLPGRQRHLQIGLGEGAAHRLVWDVGQILGLGPGLSAGRRWRPGRRRPSPRRREGSRGGTGHGGRAWGFLLLGARTCASACLGAGGASAAGGLRRLPAGGS